MPNWMQSDDLRQWADVWAKFTLGVAGIMVSVVLGWTQFDIQKQLRSDQDEKFMIQQFNHYLESYFGQNGSGTDLDLIFSFAEKINKYHKNPLYRDIVLGFDHDDRFIKLLDESPARNHKYKDLLIDRRKGLTHVRNEYFAVIYSVKKLSQAKNLATQAAGKMEDIEDDYIKPSTRIYRSTKNNWYAVVLGKPGDKKEMDRVASVAENNQIGDGPYATANLEWPHVATCNSRKCW